MKILYHCDHCDCAWSDPDVILEHEKECHKNPENKTCDSCKHQKLLLINESYYCELETDFNKQYNHSYIINCTKWDTNDRQLSRKFKLKQINESIH